MPEKGKLVLIYIFYTNNPYRICYLLFCIFIILPLLFSFFLFFVFQLHHRALDKQYFISTVHISSLTIKHDGMQYGCPKCCSRSTYDVWVNVISRYSTFQDLGHFQLWNIQSILFARWLLIYQKLELKLTSQFMTPLKLISKLTIKKYN